MKIAVIGRTSVLYNTASILRDNGYEIACILTSKEAPEYKSNADNFLDFSRKWNIPYACSSKISEYEDFLRESKADIAVSVNYSGIIPKVITDIFSLGILNAHGGDLPRYRGNACQAWAILMGEKRIGLCIHRMIGDELDSGDIIAREYFGIDLETKISHVYDWIGIRAPILFLDAIKKIEFDPLYILERQSKDLADALRCYPRDPEDGKINWQSSSEDIIRLINVSGSPYPGAYCLYDDNLLRIHDATYGDQEESYLAVPGQIIRITSDYLEVATGRGKIKLTKIEISGELVRPDLVFKTIRARLK